MDEQVGAFVYHSFSPGFIVLSYFVSVVGCWTALELLHRRTSTRGTYNWFLLLGAATSMGAVAIWSMHFIGNRAITMAGGQSYMQIAYSPGFTAGSFLLPIIVVGLAFWLFSVSDSVTVIGTVVGGLTTGFAVCGMHYLGQGGIANYQTVYDWKFILGAAIIAVVASTIALGVFFYFKSTWTNAWWKRFLCALLLAVAVSGMHWCATFGTSYRLLSMTGADQAGLSRRATVIVVMCLSLGCCLTLLIFAIIGERSRQKYANRAQQVILACATWDPEGRLMVTPDGSLPCRKITDSFMERSFEDVFSIEHPVFCWVFRVSRYWSGVADLIPGMRNHLRTTNFVKNSRGGSTVKGRDYIEGSEDYSQIFKELFCVAAYDLAMMIQQPLADLGVLYDEIISTGTLKKSTRAKLALKTNGNYDLERAHPGAMTFGRGQLLVVVRRTTRLEATQLQAAGYRFAAVPNVIDHISRAMQIGSEELRVRLEKMRNFSGIPEILEHGVYLACFAIRPLFQRGFDTLVRRDAKNLLPTARLDLPELQRWHTDFISRMDDWTITQCLDWLRKTSLDAEPTEKEFIGQLYKGINLLVSQIESQFFQEARLTARPLRAACRSANGNGPPGQAMIIAFRVMTDIHQSRTLNRELEFIPSQFFKCQQMVYPNSPDHAVFAGRVHREFASVIQRKPQASTSDLRHSIVSSKSFGDFLGRAPSTPSIPRIFKASRADGIPLRVDNDNSSEKNLVETTVYNPFGGIHVSNEISIDISELRDGNRSPDVEMANLGVRSEVGVALVERESFVDELMNLTCGERWRQR